VSAKILYFQRHPATSKSLKPKTAGLMRKRRSPAQPSKIKKYTVGIEPTARQLDTADAPTPSCRATADVPPNASMMSSTDLSMPERSSDNLNLSSVQPTVLDFRTGECFDDRMDTALIIGERLDVWLEAEGKKAVEICAAIGEEENKFSQWRNGKHRLALEAADALCNRYGLTLDWLYRGDMRGLPHELHNKISAVLQKRKRIRA
jgi:hypothetical protein